MTLLPYLEHLAADSMRFRDAVLAADPETRVPTCPDWDGDDLLWHLGEVQWFWGQIVSGPIVDGAAVHALDPGERPADRAGLLDFFDAASARLQRGLRGTAPDTPAWTWSAEQTTGFIRRRQAHEAMIHRVDAELLTGERTGMDAALSADGVDEVLRVMFAALPPWATLAAETGRAVRIEAVDTGDVWVVRSGRQTGIHPRSGESVDEPTLDMLDEDGKHDAMVSGTASDLDCWLWGRPPLGELERAGSPAALEGLDAVVGDGIQ